MKISIYFIIVLFSIIPFYILLHLQKQNNSNNLCNASIEIEVKESSELYNELEYNYCGDDGYLQVNILAIQREILSQNGVNQSDNEAILISTRHGDVLKLNYPYNNENIEEICSPGFGAGGLSDIAVNQQNEIFLCSFSYIFGLDSSNCELEELFNFEFGVGVNSLSFDIEGNLYYGNSTSKVYRYDADQQSQPYIWHDFDSGNAGGDYVILNDKMYISWENDTGFKLYEVTVDNNFNYISHIDLGQLPNQTFGLAGELGTLYGVTPEKIFKINLDNFSFRDVIYNDGTFDEWWGAAGLHESQIIETSAYISNDDALNSNNPLPDLWTNTETGENIIFIRIDNVTTGDFSIFPVSINIRIIPSINQPNDVAICSDQTTNTFDLTGVEDDLLVNVSQEVTVTYYETYFDLWNSINSLSNIFSTSSLEKEIFVKVETSNCYDYTSFYLITNILPSIENLVNEPTERLLQNCYIDNQEQGYFDLNEIYDTIIGDDYYNLEFYFTYENAENQINSLNSLYYSSLGIIQEFFVRVTNDKGCYSITNFFMDGNCVLTTNNLSNIFFPKFFTPNGDGINEYWNVKGISNKLKNESEISIFNRYGKLLTSFVPSQTLGWDGNGMYSDDFWYQLEMKNGKTFVGHFSLVR